MKILHVNTLDSSGGAARAAYRLHRGLLNEGVDSQMLVQDKVGDDYSVLGNETIKEKVLSKMRPVLDSIPVRFYPKKTKSLFSPSWLPFGNIVNKINKINPDIVHLHWICHGMIRIEDLQKIKAPVVWTLHDNWAFTGGCHIMWECEKYQDKCGACPRLGSVKEKDLSRKVFQKKAKTFLKMQKMTIVGVSSWLANCAQKSTLFKNKKVENIPNLLETDLYTPMEKEKARKLWKLPQDKKLILFGANSATSDINKGFKELSEALSQLKINDVEFVVFGSNEPKEPQNFKFKTHYLGHLYDDASQVALYSACDVMIVPSRQEAFGLTASEAMSCGTPVVAFGSTGLLDIVEHKKTGYLAKPFESADLANGIDWVLNNKNYNELCENSRNKVLKSFDSKIVSGKYVKLYEDILN